jgi:hypothetical protein
VGVKEQDQHHHQHKVAVKLKRKGGDQRSCLLKVSVLSYLIFVTVLDILQKVFYSSNAGRESFVDMCASEYVQKVTFDSYLYKKVQGNNPIEDLKLGVETVGSLLKNYVVTPPDGPLASQRK